MRKIKGFLKSYGKLSVFEHNPYNHLTCRIVNACPFDFDAIRLKPSEMKSLLIKNTDSIYSKRDIVPLLEKTAPGFSARVISLKIPEYDEKSAESVEKVDKASPQT